MVKIHLVRKAARRTRNVPCPIRFSCPKSSFPARWHGPGPPPRGRPVLVPIAFERSFRMAYSRTHYGTGYYIYTSTSTGETFSTAARMAPRNRPSRRAEFIGRAGTDIAPRPEHLGRSRRVRESRPCPRRSRHPRSAHERAGTCSGPWSSTSKGIGAGIWTRPAPHHLGRPAQPSIEAPVASSSAPHPLQPRCPRVPREGLSRPHPRRRPARPPAAYFPNAVLSAPLASS